MLATIEKVKEKPILFSAPMVRAILDGRKTQTRRTLKIQPAEKETGRWAWIASSTEAGETGKFSYSWVDDKGESRTIRGRESSVRLHCPYGAPGDKLWVRESFAVCADNNIFYRADGKPDPWDDIKWRPSIHMPRRASRITLQIKSVHVERLNAISESDANAEGVPKRNQEGWIDGTSMKLGTTWFRGLWETINGAGSWELNPWVWVVEFKAV
jgi:hypothetical protein